MKINIIGSGYMGKQIASLFKVIGFNVIIWHNSKSNDLINELDLESKKLEKIFNTKSSGSIEIEKDLNKFENNFTIETVKENLDIKKKVISCLKYKENIFSNTSSLKLSEIGSHVNGFHFMNPISLKFVEICKNSNFSKDILEKIISKLTIHFYKIIEVNDTPGFLINKIIFKDISYFFYLIEKESFSIEDVTIIFKSNIKTNNPIKLINMIGVDTSLYILENLKKYDDSFYVPEVLRKAVLNGTLGFKNKKLFKI
jgi:3-hydroxybutyryl-CoA dehydrogenase